MARPRAVVYLLTMLTVLSACSSTTSTPPPAPSVAAASTARPSALAEASISPQASVASAPASPSAAASASAVASASAAATVSASAAASPDAATSSAAPDASPDPTAPSAAPVAVAPAVTFGEAWEPVECATLGVAAEIAAQATDCGYVTVLENRATGGDTTIQLGVVRVRTDAATPGTPVVLAVGGPGGNGLERTSNLAYVLPFVPLFGNHDVVFFSQRGTEHAVPHLDCPEYSRIDADALRNGWSNDARRAERVPRMQACVDSFRAAGVDLSAYNSNENAADVADITDALGYEKISLYGQSYGTQLAQFVMRNHPEILDSVILDGVLPVVLASENESDVPNSGIGQIFADCAADPVCNSTYPDAEDAFRDAYAALDADPRPIELVLEGTPITAPVDGLLAGAAVLDLAGSASGSATLPYVVTQLRDGNYEPLFPYLSGNIQPSSGVSRVMHFSIVCSDDPYPELPVPAPGDAYANLKYDDDVQYTAICPIMGVTRLPDSSDEPVRSDIPTLILQGAYDRPTPPADGDRVAETLPNSSTVVFSVGPHVNGDTACGVGIINAFLADPSTAPDASCAQQPIAFAVPQTVTATSEDGTATLSATLPPGWTARGNGTYLDASANAVVLSVLPPQAPEDALAKATDRLGGGGTIADGEPIAGLPTKRYQLSGSVQGAVTINVDAVAFGDDAATYLIYTQNQTPGVLNLWRSSVLPAILQTATVGRP